MFIIATISPNRKVSHKMKYILHIKTEFCLGGGLLMKAPSHVLVWEYHLTPFSIKKSFMLHIEAASFGGGGVPSWENAERKWINTWSRIIQSVTVARFLWSALFSLVHRFKPRSWVPILISYHGKVGEIVLIGRGCEFNFSSREN